MYYVRFRTYSLYKFKLNTIVIFFFSFVSPNCTFLYIQFKVFSRFQSARESISSEECVAFMLNFFTNTNFWCKAISFLHTLRVYIYFIRKIRKTALFPLFIPTFLSSASQLNTYRNSAISRLFVFFIGQFTHLFSSFWHCNVFTFCFFLSLA